MKQLISFIFIITMLLGFSIPGGAIETSSDTALLMDAETGQILYESNGYQTVAAGTFGKIVSVLTAVENGNLKERITVDASSLEQTNDPTISLVNGEIITLQDLLYAEMLANANDAAYVVADHFTTEEDDDYGEFITMMAKELDYCMASTMTMDNVDGAITTEQMCSCVDLANMIRFGTKNDDFRTIFTADNYTIDATNATEQERNLESQHKMVNGTVDYSGVKGGFVSVSDTGEYRSITYAERRLGESNPKEQRKLIAVVLHSESEESMYQDIETLLDYGFGLQKVSADEKELLSFLPDTISSRDIAFESGVSLLLPEGDLIEDLDYRVSVDECGYFRGNITFYHSDQAIAAKAAFYEVQKESVLIPWIKRIALILVAIGILLALFLGIRMMTQKHQKSRQLQEKVQGKNKPRKRVDPNISSGLDFGNEYDNDPEYREYRQKQHQEYLRRRYAETGDHRYSKEWLDQQPKISQNQKRAQQKSTRRRNSKGKNNRKRG